MNLDNVFYGYTIDGKNRCLLRRYKKEITSMGEVNCTVYYDLEEKKEFSVMDVDVQTLKSIKNIVGDKTRMSRRKVVKVYSADRDILIDVKGTFYGDIIRKQTYEETLKKCDAISGSGSFSKHQPFETAIEKNVMFARIPDPDGRVMDLETSELFYLNNRVFNGIVAKVQRPINYQQFDTSVQTKRKLLEMDYRKEL